MVRSGEELMGLSGKTVPEFGQLRASATLPPGQDITLQSFTYEDRQASLVQANITIKAPRSRISETQNNIIKRDSSVMKSTFHQLHLMQ